MENSFSLSLEDELSKFYNSKEACENNFSPMEYQLFIKEFLKTIPDDYPCEGIFSSHYGWRRNPFGRSCYEYHKGYDIANKKGTPIRSTISGIVIFSGINHGGYGECIIIIEKQYGYYTTLYAHLSKRLVNVGEKVKKHQKIGEMGSTGRSTGPHCHYEIRVNGKAINPSRIWKLNKNFMLK